MATGLAGFSFLRRSDAGEVCPVKLLPMKSGEVFKRGTPVNLESGLCCAGAPADTYLVGVSNQEVTASADGEMLEVILGYPTVVFRVGFTNAGTKKTFTDANIGTAYDLLSTNNRLIDPDDSAGGAWIVVGYNNTKLTVDVVLDTEKAANIIGGSVDDVT